jgi:cell wall-associated NlpC family hydrolase
VPVPTPAGRHRHAPFRRARTAVVGGLLALGLATTGLVAPVAGAATPSASARIVSIAKRYVGHARYVEGGASPKHGFDCSGYTEYVYAHAHVAKLPHNAEAQRRMRHMHRVSKKSRRAGDLIFYMSGGQAYHVAIYAGHGEQYAAATPRDGIRHQKIWSSDVRYGRYRR